MKGDPLDDPTLENVGIVVEDLAATTEFFVALRQWGDSEQSAAGAVERRPTGTSSRLTASSWSTGCSAPGRRTGDAVMA
jgi:hypothetical protein